MNDFEKTAVAKKARDETAYQKGVREGFSQGMWLMIALGGVTYWLVEFIS